MAQEMYFLYLDGVQRGPYTVHQIGHMVNSGIIHRDAMFWCEGLDQWQPVTQLITPKEELKRRRLRFGMAASLALLGVVGLGWLILPALRQGWREEHQVEMTPNAAYWRARGVLRRHLGAINAVGFEEFNAGSVRLLKANLAEVELSIRGDSSNDESKGGRWRVEVSYDTRLKMWVPAEVAPRKMQ